MAPYLFVIENWICKFRWSTCENKYVFWWYRCEERYEVVAINFQYYLSLNQRSTLYNIVEVECYDDNIELVGIDIQVVEAQNPRICQQECQKQIQCHYWTFDKLSDGQGFNCYLKSKNDYKLQNSKRISGPKYCGK